MKRKLGGMRAAGFGLMGMAAGFGLVLLVMNLAWGKKEYGKPAKAPEATGTRLAGLMDNREPGEVADKAARDIKAEPDKYDRSHHRAKR